MLPYRGGQQGQQQQGQGQQGQGQNRWFATRSMTDRLEGFVNKRKEEGGWLAEKLAKNLSGRGQMQGGGAEGGSDSQHPRHGGDAKAAPGQFSA